MANRNGSVFNILSIDGGGIRGMYPAQVLQLVQDRLGVNVSEHFQMLAGTSTGSIIAAAIAVGKAPDKIVELYRSKGADIFGDKIASFWPAAVKQGVHSKYQSKKLSELLRCEFADTTLGDIVKPLLIPATDIGSGSVHVLKSGYSDDFTRDRSVRVRDAVLASCSAPAFFDPTKVGNYLLADGGLWANNPSLAAVIDAQHRLGVEIGRIRVFSIGTGHSKTAYGTKQNRRWGLINGWQHISFVSFLMSLQAQSAHNYLRLMLPETQILRVDFESDLPLPLDDIETIDDLCARADKDFTYMSKRISDFLKV